MARGLWLPRPDSACYYRRIFMKKRACLCGRVFFICRAYDIKHGIFLNMIDIRKSWEYNHGVVLQLLSCSSLSNLS